MTVSQALKNLADVFFDEDTGLADMLVDEFNNTPDFVDGMYAGFDAAKAILLGVADHFEDLEALNG